MHLMILPLQELICFTYNYAIHIKTKNGGLANKQIQCMSYSLLHAVICFLIIPHQTVFTKKTRKDLPLHPSHCKLKLRQINWADLQQHTHKKYFSFLPVILNHQTISQCNRVLLEKLTPQPVKKIPKFYRTQKFSDAFQNSLLPVPILRPQNAILS